MEGKAFCGYRLTRGNAARNGRLRSGLWFSRLESLYKSKNLHEKALFCHGAAFGKEEAEECEEVELK